MDLMVLPAKTAVLEGSKSVQRFNVAMHRWMITDERVLEGVIGVLNG
jgi:hypothetical protein